MKPTLTEENRWERFMYCLEKRSVESGLAKYEDILNFIFVDKKWFFLTQEAMKVYLTQGENKPYRTTKHKSHILKLMEICLLARPQYDPVTNTWWDGKLGCWTFAEEVAAKRSSRNRPRGTIELKPVTITKEVYAQYLRLYLIPAILNNWPRKTGPDGNLIDEYLFLQQDNAPVHVSKDEFQEIMSEFQNTNGIHLELAYQPPNSPDLNILDLAFFALYRQITLKIKVSTYKSSKQKLKQHIGHIQGRK